MGLCVHAHVWEKKKWESDSKRDNLHKDRKDAYFRKHTACILQKTAKTIVYSSLLNISVLKFNWIKAGGRETWINLRNTKFVGIKIKPNIHTSKFNNLNLTPEKYSQG